MKKIVLLNGLEDTVTIPVFQSITKDIVGHLKLGDIPISHRTDVLLEKNDGPTTIDKNLHNTYLEANYQLEPINELGGYRVPVHPDNKPFFKDRDSRVTMTTSYRSVRFNFELVLKSKSRSTINRVIDLLYHRKVDVDSFDTHNIQISYTIPDSVKKFMLDIHKLRSKYEPDLDITTYLKGVLDMEQIDASLSLANNKFKDAMVVTEYQVEVVGEYMGELSNVTLDKDDMYYTLPINYQIMLQRPLAIHLNYPIVIYNQLVPKPFRGTINKQFIANIRNKDKAMFTLLRKYDSFGISNTGYYLKYPRYDDYTIPNKINNYTPIITVLTMVNTNKPHELFNIKTDIPNMKFKDKVFDVMLLHKDTISEYLGGLFYFVLYKNEEEFMYNEIILDKDGNLTTRTPMDIKNTYRVGIHLCDNVHAINGKVRWTFIQFINKEIIDNMNKVRKLSDLGIDRQKISIRINNNNLGEEVYKTESLFFDVYLELFDIHPDEVTNLINNWTTQGPGEILFRLQMPDYSWPKLTMLHHTKVYKLFDYEE